MAPHNRHYVVKLAKESEGNGEKTGETQAGEGSGCLSGLGFLHDFLFLLYFSEKMLKKSLKFPLLLSCDNEIF